jgi:hypothetical protein
MKQRITADDNYEAIHGLSYFESMIESVLHFLDAFTIDFLLKFGIIIL